MSLIDKDGLRHGGGRRGLRGRRRARRRRARPRRTLCSTALSLEDVTLPAVFSVAERPGRARRGVPRQCSAPIRQRSARSPRRSAATRTEATGRRSARACVLGAGTTIVAPRIVLEDGVRDRRRRHRPCEEVFAAGELAGFGRVVDVHVPPGVHRRRHLDRGATCRSEAAATATRGRRSSIGDLAFVRGRGVRERLPARRDRARGVPHHALDARRRTTSATPCSKASRTASPGSCSRTARRSASARSSTRAAARPRGDRRLELVRGDRHARGHARGRRPGADDRPRESCSVEGASGRAREDGCVDELAELLRLSGVETGRLDEGSRGFELTGAEGPARVVFVESIGKDAAVPAGDGETVVLTLDACGRHPARVRGARPARAAGHRRGRRAARLGSRVLPQARDPLRAGPVALPRRARLTPDSEAVRSAT